MKKIITLDNLNVIKNEVDNKLEAYATSESVTEGLSVKVDAIEGMGLSENSFTTAEKEKLSALNISHQTKWVYEYNFTANTTRKIAEISGTYGDGQLSIVNCSFDCVLLYDFVYSEPEGGSNDVVMHYHAQINNGKLVGFSFGTNLRPVLLDNYISFDAYLTHNTESRTFAAEIYATTKRTTSGRLTLLSECNRGSFAANEWTLSYKTANKPTEHLAYSKLITFPSKIDSELADLKGYIGYTDSDIYGLEVDFDNNRFTRLAGAVGKTAGADFDSVNAFGGRRRCNVADDGTVTAYYGEEGFVTGGTNADGVHVQVMVEQPRFYYKVVPLKTEKQAGTEDGYILRKARYYISDTPKLGFKLHPAFIENGNENEKIYLSAFEGSLFDASANAYILDNAQVADFAADKLSSIAGAKPAGGDTQNLTRANTRLLAQKRGKGWEQAYAATAAASQLLMLIEYASFNMQTAIGMGNTGQGSSAANIQYTGATVSLGNASGTVTNANNIQLVSYRGEENFWGNIWGWVDGMNKENPATFESGDFGTLYVADHGFADDSKAAPYKNTGIHPIQGNGYVSAFGYSEEFDWLFVAIEYSGNNALPVGDYAWNNNPGWRVAQLGGFCVDGSGAGAFYWALDSAASGRGWNVGGRLVYVPSKSEEGTE